MAQTGGKLFTVISATVFVGVEAVVSAVAGGWAVAGLLNLGDIGEYVLMALFTLPALYATLRYGQRAARTEAALSH